MKPTNRAVLVLVAAGFLTACGGWTRMAYEEAAGGKGRLDFVLIDDAMPSPRILWRESPIFASAVRTIEPDLPGCERVTFYANPTEDDMNAVGDEPTRVHPEVWENEAELIEQRRVLPNDPCAIGIFAGTIEASRTTGVFAYTASGESHTLFDAIPESVEGDTNWWLLAPVWLAYEPASWIDAGMRAADAQNRVTEPVTVVVEITDGERLEVTLDYDRAVELLKEHIYVQPHHSPTNAPWNQRRFWVWAALLELELDFREAAESFDDRHVTTLVSVEGHVGSWRVRALDTGGGSDYLAMPIEEDRAFLVYD